MSAPPVIKSDIAVELIMAFSLPLLFNTSRRFAIYSPAILTCLETSVRTVSAGYEKTISLESKTLERGMTGAMGSLLFSTSISTAKLSSPSVSILITGDISFCLICSLSSQSETAFAVCLS